MLRFGLPGNDCTEDEKTAGEVGRLRQPTSCAVLGSQVQAPDAADRSVSSSQYDVSNFQIISWSKMSQNQIFK